MLQDKVAVITGSTSGIGLAIARGLAAKGAGIVLNSFESGGANDELAAALGREAGVPASFVTADMSRPDQIRGLIAEAERRHGRVDILVNNAGIQHVQPIHEFPEDRWDAVLAVNLSAAFHATKAVLPGVKARRWGRIINLASAHGLVASAFKSAYVAAKHGVVGLTKVTALEVAEEGITANAICPGYVWTPLVENQVPDQARNHGMSEDEVVRKIFLADQPTRKFVTVEEVAALAVFLASDGAASITGTALPIDGGWTAH